MASGSFGPTTAGRMDSYVDKFMEHGGSMISLAKGNRSRAVTRACQTHGGFYLGSIGGPAAILAEKCIKKVGRVAVPGCTVHLSGREHSHMVLGIPSPQVEVLEYHELGMEAVHKIEVEKFPAFIVCDDKGNDFFKKWLGES